MLDKDRFGTGLLIGILVPLGLYALFYVSLEASGRYMTGTISENMQLFTIAVNAFLMRWFLVKREQDNIGRGILLITLLFALGHFSYYYTDLIR